MSPARDVSLWMARILRERSVGWLHSHIGYVLQTPNLFSGTIRDNIRYGRRDASDEEVEQVARLIQAHDFISRMEKGYDTEVGEGGDRSVNRDRSS